MISPKKISCFLSLFLLGTLSLSVALAWQQAEEETYSIFLTKTAEADKKQQTVMIGDKKVLTQVHIVKKGEYVWKILAEKGLVRKDRPTEVMALVKALNTSFPDLNRIYPGQKIIIPVVMPQGEGPPVAEGPREKRTPEVPEGEKYTVRPGDTLVKIIHGRYPIPKEDLYDEYLDLVKKVNPSFPDLDHIYPGQTIRIPFYSGKIPPIPAVSPPSEGKRPEQVSKGESDLSRDLSQILTQIGEEWIQTGEHVIPIKAGGQIKLKAESYPMISLSSGIRVIVDLYSDLPEKMSNLIESSWDLYKVVRLKGHNLRTALDLIFSACKYPRVYGKGEPLEIRMGVPAQLTADWIIERSSGQSSGKNSIIMITLMDETLPATPQGIKALLGNQGIKIIDYPPKDAPPMDASIKAGVLETVQDTAAMVEMLLNLAGQKFQKKVEMPIYQNQKGNLALIIQADYTLTVNGRGYVIDLSGLGPEILSLLKENNQSVLSLGHEKDPIPIVSKVLEFIGMKFDSTPYSFLATGRDPSRNVRFTIPAITFQDQHGQPVLATDLKMPLEITTFLTQKGYTILSLPLS